VGDLGFGADLHRLGLIIQEKPAKLSVSCDFEI